YEAYPRASVQATRSFPRSLSLPPRPPRSPLFPYTTLFRSCLRPGFRVGVAGDHVRHRGAVAAAAVTDLDDLQVERGEHQLDLARSEEHTSELQSPYDLVCRLLLEKKKKK